MVASTAFGHPTTPGRTTMRTRVTLSVAVVALTTVAVIGLPVVFTGRVGATPGSGVSTTFLARGTSDGDVKIRAKGPTEIVFAEITIEPGASTGWHTHPGPLVVAVRSGTLTRYLADCRAETSTAGDSFIEHAGRRAVHMGVNRGREPVVLLVSYVVPFGGPLSDVAREPACASTR
jgi:quercetin dioxygenase-like cupin family protein